MRSISVTLLFLTIGFFLHFCFVGKFVLQYILSFLFSGSFLPSRSSFTGSPSVIWLGARWARDTTISLRSSRSFTTLVHCFGLRPQTWAIVSRVSKQTPFPSKEHFCRMRSMTDISKAVRKCGHRSWGNLVNKTHHPCCKERAILVGRKHVRFVSGERKVCPCFTAWVFFCQ